MRWYHVGAAAGVAYAVLLVFVIWWDTPMERERPKITPSPYFWHIKDERDPREDTLHPG